MANVDFRPIKMDRGNEPVVIAANIEHYQLANFVSRRERLSQLIERREFSFLHDLKPTNQRALAIWMPFPKLLQSFTRDNMHDYSISQYEIANKLRGIIRPFRRAAQTSDETPA